MQPQDIEIQFREILDECYGFDQRNLQAMIAFEETQETQYNQGNSLCGE